MIDDIDILDRFISSDVQALNITEKNDGDVGFHEARRPQYELKAERPIHRLIVLKAMEGYTNVEIADQMGITNSTVNYVLLQPWAVEYMSKHLHKNGMERVELLLREAAAPAVVQLITEMQNPKARSGERSTAADKILDRLYGRAAQPIIHHQAMDIDKMSDAEIAARLSELQKTRS